MDSPIWIVTTIVFFFLALGLLIAAIYFFQKSPSETQCRNLYPCVPTQQECNTLFPCSTNTCPSFWIEVLNNSANVITQDGNNVITSSSSQPQTQAWKLVQSQGKFAIQNSTSQRYITVQNNTTTSVSSQPFLFDLESHIYGTVIRFNNFMLSFKGQNNELSIVPYSDTIGLDARWTFLPINY